MTALRLAWIEFWRCFRWTQTSSGRDFMWLALLLACLQLLALLLTASRDGVLDRSVDAFLGNKAGYGVPVWVIANGLHSRSIGLIEADILNGIEKDGIRTAPFRSLEGREFFSWPSQDVWREAGASFDGLAVEEDGPLWRRGRNEIAGTAPNRDEHRNWRLVLNLDSFQEAFDPRAYLDALRNRLPPNEIAEVERSINDLSTMNHIWLEMRLHRRHLAKFEVSWAQGIGVGLGEVAYLVPLRLVNMMNEIHYSPTSLCAFLEQGPGEQVRVGSLESKRFKRRDRTGERAAEFERTKIAFETLAMRLGAKLRPDSAGRLRMTMPFWDGSRYRDGEICDPGIPKDFVAAHAMGVGLDPADLVFRQIQKSSYYTGLTSQKVDISCKALSDRRREQGVAAPDAADGACLQRIEFGNQGGEGFDQALIFAADRTEISKLVSYLACKPVAGLPLPEMRRPLCLPDPPDAESATEVEIDEWAALKPESRLRLTRIYQGSLDRFNFLTSLLDLLRTPLGGAMAALLVLITWVQIGALIGNRRTRYGMLLAKGASWSMVTSMVLVQVAMAVLVGFVFAGAAFFAITMIIGPGAADLSATYKSITEGAALNPLPLDASNVLDVYAGTWFVASVLTIIQVRLNKITPKHPLDLLLG